MQVIFRTDNHIEGHDRLATYASEVVTHVLGRFDEHVTRVDVHLSESGSKDASERTRCVMEAHVGGKPPVAVSHLGEDEGASLDGGAKKLRRALDTVFGKMHDHHA
jgi:ribosome-associated translation inhibitor RaiA